MSLGSSELVEGKFGEMFCCDNRVRVGYDVFCGETEDGLEEAALPGSVSVPWRTMVKSCMATLSVTYKRHTLI